MRWPGSKNITFAIFFIFMVYLGAANESLFAATRYVSDRLVVSVRVGQNNTSDVLGYIQSDMPVDVLEEKGRYLKIKTENGLEGWVNSKYITSEKPDILIVNDLQDEINILQRRIEIFEDKAVTSTPIPSANGSYEQKITELERTIKTHKQMSSNRKGELEKLKTENANLKLKMGHLKNQSPVKFKNIHWFLVGAGVLLFGFVIGRSARRQKRTSIYR